MRTNWALAAAFEIHKRYWYIAQQLRFPSPSGFGIGISLGEVVRIDPETFIPEMNEPDFVGYPMNCGARLQKLAGPYGTVIDSGSSSAVVIARYLDLWLSTILPAHHSGRRQPHFLTFRSSVDAFSPSACPARR